MKCDSALQLEEAIANFLSVARAKALSERTIEYYEDRLLDFMRYCEDCVTKIDEVNTKPERTSASGRSG